MGSPLGPAFANLFMGYRERKWLESEEGNNVIFYKRYVYDTFCVFHNELDAEKSLLYLNNQHANLQFTIEKEKERQLPFLDVLDGINEQTFTTRLFRKKTYTGLLTNFNSFTPFKYKVGLIKTLIDRTFKINSSWSGFHGDISKIKTTLERNEFPSSLIDKHIKNYVETQHNSDKTLLSETVIPEPRYYMLPFVGVFSLHCQKKLDNVIKRLCKTEVLIKLIFTPFKISTMFSAKDPVPYALKSHVVYKFVCGSCNASYIGETARHLSTRIKEHLETDKQSYVYKHLLSSSACKLVCNENCFSILDHAQSKFALRIKEGMHVEW